MHAITLSYSLSYAAAVRLGVARSGTATLDAAPVLCQLGTAERAWLAEHPKVVFSLDAVVEGADDLVGERLATAVAREVRNACAADDPARLRAAVAHQLVVKLDEARAGEYVVARVSLPRRVSDGASHLSGGVDVLTDADVGPTLLRALERYLDRCVAGLRRPYVDGLGAAERGGPGLLRAAYADGVAQYEDRVVRLAIDAAKAGPLLCWTSDSRWARLRHAEGAVGVEVVDDKKAPEGRAFRVSNSAGAVRDKRLAGVIEASIRQLELAEAEARERVAAHAACDALLTAVVEAAICHALDADQCARRELGALPASELDAALRDDLFARFSRDVGRAGVAGKLDADERVVWGELPYGGFDVARVLDGLSYVEDWGATDEGAVAVRVFDNAGAEHLFAVDLV